MKSLVGKFGTLALLAAVGGFAVQGCSSDVASPAHDGQSAEGDSGNVTLNLVPVSGITVNSVNYVVTGTPAIAGTPLPSGVLPTPGNAKDFTVGIPVPVGTGYTLSLTAVSAETGDDITCTGSHGPFDVTPNSSTAFPMTLTCVQNDTGSIIATVDVKTNACPRLLPDFATAIPGAANVGDTIELNALGHDLDGKTVSYAWSIPAANSAVGTFTAATAQNAHFLCKAQGDSVPVTVTLKNGECSKELKTTISCKSLLCGNGVVDAGETCDKALTPDTCPDDCTVACGDGVIEKSETCEVPGGIGNDTCTDTCVARVPSCGDGFFTNVAAGGKPAEACDGAKVPAGTPAGSVCKADCSGFDVLRCGDGIVTASLGEECELPGTANCSNDCQFLASKDCTDCEAGSACAPFATACLTSAGTATPEAQANCFDVEECIVDTNCADGASTFSSCFCGTLSNGDCAAAPETGPNAPKGACAALIKAGSGAGATNTNVLARITNRNFSAGAGINRFNCLKNNPACSPLCGF